MICKIMINFLVTALSLLLIKFKYPRKKEYLRKKSYRSVPRLPPVIVGPFDGNGEDESNKSNLNNNPKVPYDIFPLTGNKYPRIIKGLYMKKFLKITKLSNIKITRYR